MKKTIGYLGIIALMAVIGFSMAACDNGTTSKLQGTWSKGDLKIVIDGTSVVLKSNATFWSRGTFTDTASTITISITDYTSNAGSNWTAYTDSVTFNYTLSGNTLIASGMAGDYAQYNGTWAK